MSAAADVLNRSPWLAVFVAAMVAGALAAAFAGLLKPAGLPGGRPAAAIVGGTVAGVLLNAVVLGAAAPEIHRALFQGAEPQRQALAEADRRLDLERFAAERLDATPNMPQDEQASAAQAELERAEHAFDAAIGRHRTRHRSLYAAAGGLVLSLSVLAAPACAFPTRRRASAGWGRVHVRDDEAGERRASDGVPTAAGRGFLHSTQFVSALFAAALLACAVLLLTPLTLVTAACVGLLWSMPGTLRAAPGSRAAAALWPAAGVVGLIILLLAVAPSPSVPALDLEPLVSAFAGLSVSAAWPSAATVLAGLAWLLMFAAVAALAFRGAVRLQRVARAVLWRFAVPALLACLIAAAPLGDAAATPGFLALVLLGVLVAGDLRWMTHFAVRGSVEPALRRPWAVTARPLSRGAAAVQIAVLALAADPFEPAAAALVLASVLMLFEVEALRAVRLRAVFALENRDHELPGGGGGVGGRGEDRPTRGRSGTRSPAQDENASDGSSA